MRSSNPALSRGFGDRARPVAGSGQMTINGAINKTGLLVLMALFTAYWSWTETVQTNMYGEITAQPPGYMWILMLVGLGLLLGIIFKPTLSPFLAPAYALCQGVIIGAVSALFEVQYSGIVFQAVIGTFGTLFGMLFMYRAGIIKVTDKFRSILMLATFGIFAIYLVGWIMSFFGSGIPMIHEAGPVGIGFSVIVCGIAALNLLLDFDYIERGARQRSPQYMEWFAAFGLLVTLIWLYFEILRLLAKTRSR